MNETLEKKRLSLLTDGTEPSASIAGWKTVDGNLVMADYFYEKWAKDAEQVVVHKMENNEVTAAIYGNPDQGTWHFDRLKKHVDIISEALARAEGTPCEKRAILTAGRPGSGKTSRLAAKDGEEFFHIDADDFKRALIEKGMAPDVPGITPFETAPLIHSESNHLAMMTFAELARQGVNVMLEQTMSSDKYVTRRASTLREQGYKIKGILMEITEATARRRCAARHRKGLEDFLIRKEGFGGRLVPKFVSAHESHSVFKMLQGSGWLDEVEVYDNDTDGEEPKKKDYVGKAKPHAPTFKSSPYESVVPWSAVTFTPITVGDWTWIA